MIVLLIIYPTVSFIVAVINLLALAITVDNGDYDNYYSDIEAIHDWWLGDKYNIMKVLKGILLFVGLIPINLWFIGKWLTQVEE